MHVVRNGKRKSFTFNKLSDLTPASQLQAQKGVPRVVLEALLLTLR